MNSVKPTTPYNSIRDVALEDTSNRSIVDAHSIWKDSPTLIFVVRRPGCWLCRSHAAKLSSHRELIQEILGVKMIAVVHERLDDEIEQFNTYWNGKVYLDNDKGFFRALGNGEVKFGNLGNVFRPAVWKNFMKSRETAGGNFKGQGRILGGFYIVKRRSKGIAYEYREKYFGDQPKIEDLLTACGELSPNRNVESAKFALRQALDKIQKTNKAAAAETEVDCKRICADDSDDDD